MIGFLSFLVIPGSISTSFFALFFFFRELSSTILVATQLEILSSRALFFVRDDVHAVLVEV